MKKLLALLLVVGAAAQAASLPNHYRLQLQTRPAAGIMGGATDTIQVDRHGYVYKSHCVVSPRPCVREIVTRLSARAMNQIENQIERAARGRVVKEPIHAMCFVAPMSFTTYSADDGRVFLRSGDICTGVTKNISPAAANLVQTLDKLRSLSVHGVASSEELDLD